MNSCASITWIRSVGHLHRASCDAQGDISARFIRAPDCDSTVNVRACAPRRIRLLYARPLYPSQVPRRPPGRRPAMPCLPYLHTTTVALAVYPCFKEGWALGTLMRAARLLRFSPSAASQLVRARRAFCSCAFGMKTGGKGWGRGEEFALVALLILSLYELQWESTLSCRKPIPLDTIHQRLTGLWQRKLLFLWMAAAQTVSSVARYCPAVAIPRPRQM